MADTQSDGPATDRKNDPVVDPSKNVDALFEAGMAHQTAMREKDASHLRELMAKEAAHTVERIASAKGLRKALIQAIGEKFVSVKEKFASIDMQLALIERMRVEQKADTQKAVDAALAAQKEAVREQTTASDLAIGKSEASTEKRVDQQGITFATAIAGVLTSLGDLKERLSRIENLRQGGAEQTANSRMNLGALVGVVGSFVGIVSLVLAAIVFATR